MILTGQIIGEDKPWEVLVGRAIGDFVINFDSAYNETKYNIDGTLMNFLGEKTVEEILKPNIETNPPTPLR